uniref:Mercuric resistance operon regulatory protein n=1 Tax=Acidithiobacillus ferrooxidans TaxID=920 RepID=F1C987_ACIFR|nr:putative transcriptional regulator [Acidithiobacillus ferrooxidans]
MKLLTIGALAASARVHVETVRFYQRKGLLPEPDRLRGSIRRYGQSDLERLHFVNSAKGLGYSLEEIGQLLKLADGTHCREAGELASRQLASVQARLRELHRIEYALQKQLEACNSQQGNFSCPLIDSLRELKTVS